MYYKRRQGLLPAAVRLLCEDQIIIDDFRCHFPYCVHSLHPKHLIFLFESFRDTFLFGKFFYQPKEHILCLFVLISKIAVEFPAEKQTVIEYLDAVSVLYKGIARFSQKLSFRSSIFRTKLGLIAYSCSEVAPCPLLQPKSASLFFL